jgi:hypothetical protein
LKLKVEDNIKLKMKRFITATILVGFLIFLSAPSMVSAQVAPSQCTLKHDLTGITGKKTCTKGATIDLDGADAICCFFDTVYNIVDWVFTIFLIIAVLLGLWGAYNVLTSAGSAEKVTTGRNYILYAIAGVIVAFISRAIPWIIKLIVPWG